MSENNDPQYDDPPHQHTPTAGVTQEPGWETLEYEHSSAGQPAGERTVVELLGKRRASPGRRARRAGEAPGEPARPRRHGGLSWIQAERRRGARGMCRGRDSARDHRPPKARFTRQRLRRAPSAAAHSGSHPLGASTTVKPNDERRRPQHLRPPGPEAIAACRLCRRRPQRNQQPARRPARPPRRRRCAKQTPKDKQRAARSHREPPGQAKAQSQSVNAGSTPPGRECRTAGMDERWRRSLRLHGKLQKLPALEIL